MKNIIETLYPMNRCLLGAGYDNALEFIKHLLDLEIIEIPSGTKLESWTVPNEWRIKEAWVKNKKGEKIIDYSKDPMSLMVGSYPVNAVISREDLVSHLHYSEDRPLAIPYTYNLYGDEWGFNIKRDEFMTKNKKVNKGIELENEKDFIPTLKWNFPDEQYTVFIDSENVPGKMKLGVHTIPGKSDREILLFAHLDHPFQADDNLSGVACLINMVNKIKCEHTVKIVFCPETIGSIGYATTQDISKVDFMMAVDICGNDNELVLQQSFIPSKINSAMYLSLRGSGQSFKLAKFRNLVGSDEYVFNDPKIGIPGLMLTRFPYDYYHTSDDTPEKINYESIEKTGEGILKAIEIYEKDFIPLKIFKGPLMRSKYGCQQTTHQLNLPWDYLMYSLDGTKSISELCVLYSLDFDLVHEVMEKLINDGMVKKINI